MKTMIKTSRTLRLIGLMALVLMATGISRADDAKGKDEALLRLQRAAAALHNLAAAPDKGIPDEVLAGTKCIAVVPNLTKAGFIFGAMHGRGVSTCRLAGGGWSAPAFFTITGGSWGAQIGVEDVHLVIMVMNDKGMRDLLNNKFQIEASASASAGPVGRHASAGTDWRAETEMLTYSRSKGLFAGIDLSGSWIERDKDATEAFYGRDHSNTALLTGKVHPPLNAQVFLDEVNNVKTEAKREQ
jgi:SH3 domain-containing YSC84-like protein 1